MPRINIIPTDTVIAFSATSSAQTNNYDWPTSKSTGNPMPVMGARFTLEGSATTTTTASATVQLVGLTKSGLTLAVAENTAAGQFTFTCTATAGPIILGELRLPTVGTATAQPTCAWGSPQTPWGFRVIVTTTTGATASPAPGWVLKGTLVMDMGQGHAV